MECTVATEALFSLDSTVVKRTMQPTTAETSCLNTSSMNKVSRQRSFGVRLRSILLTVEIKVSFRQIELVLWSSFVVVVNGKHGEIPYYYYTATKSFDGWYIESYKIFSVLA